MARWELSPIGQNDYERWVSPHEALTRLSHLDVETRKRTIARRLEAGLIPAAAKHCRSRYAERSLVILAPFVWKDWSCIADHGFWQSSDTDLWKVDATGYGGSSGQLQLFGVRFDPAALMDLLPNVVGSTFEVVHTAPASPRLLPPQRIRQKRQNPVSQAEIDSWYQALDTEEQALGQDRLWDLAQSNFPGRHLPRKLVVKFTEGRPTGRKPAKRPK